MSKEKEIITSKFGYKSIKYLPTQQELEEYYTKKYYQNETVQYSHKYSDDELKYFQNSANVAHYIYSNLFKDTKYSLLDVGAGEGFFANYFLEIGCNIITLDYSSYGLEQHNPNLLKTLVQGDIFRSLENLVKENKEFDLINLSNVLEHVIDPIALLETLKLLLSEQSLLRISVPNDYSHFQNFLLEKNYTTNTWLVPPDHLHYFTFESLVALLESLNYEVTLSMGEFPIELFLANDASNYVKKKDNGKLAHKSRVEVNNFLFDQGIEKYINYYKASAEIGLSRQVVIFAKIKD